MRLTIIFHAHCNSGKWPILGSLPKFLIAVLVSSLAFSSTAMGESGLKFGISTSEKASTVVKKFRPVLNVLEQELGRRLDEKTVITSVVSADYVSGMEKLVRGEVDFARIGPASYVLAKMRHSGISILAFENNQGNKQSFGIIGVKANSPIDHLIDLKGKRFAFGDESSTIGRYLAQFALAQSGVFAGDLADYRYLRRDDLVGQAVANGTFDVGAMTEEVFNRLIQEGQSLRAITKLSGISYPWVARSGLDPRLLQTLKESMLASGELEVMKTIKRDGFLPGSEQDLEPIRGVIAANPRFFQR